MTMERLKRFVEFVRQINPKFAELFETENVNIVEHSNRTRERPVLTTDKIADDDFYP